MKKLLTILLVLLTLAATYYGVWRYRLSDDVARVEASIAHHNSVFREKNRWVTFKADTVAPVGFPFASRVRITRPTLTFVAQDETYGISLPWAELSQRDAASGTYEVAYAPRAEVVFAKSGQAPEEYFVTPKETLAVLLRAQGDSRQCSMFPGAQRCPAVGPHDPLISIAMQLPQTLTVTMELNGKSRDAKFNLIALPMPVYQHIPAEMDRPLQMLVGILREALVFQK